MWGFLKCKYSYTKILIVLLSPSLAVFSLFFPGQGDSPCGPARAARAWRRKPPAGAVCCPSGCSAPRGGCQGLPEPQASPRSLPPQQHGDTQTPGRGVVPRWGPRPWPLRTSISTRGLGKSSGQKLPSPPGGGAQPVRGAGHSLPGGRGTACPGAGHRRGLAAHSSSGSHLPSRAARRLISF